MAGFVSRYAGQEGNMLTPRLEARIPDWIVTRKPKDGSIHWSTRKLGEQLGVSHMKVARVWRKHALRTQRLERYMASADPDFESGAADIIGLYLRPTQHAEVLCVNEKTAFRPTIGLTKYCH